MTGEWMGYVAATLTTIAFVPQAIKTLRSRNTRDISLSMYLVFTVGIAFWLGYGLALESWPMIGCNTITLLLAGSILGMKLRYG